MNDITFSKLSDIKDYSPLSKNIDPELIQPFIKMAETFHIRGALGQNLYDDLIDAVSGDTLTGVSYTLVQEYIIPTSIWYSLYEALPFIWTRMSAKGVTKGFSDSTTSLDKKEYEMVKQEMLEKATMYKSRLIDYLKANKSSYPLWGDTTSGKSNSSGIFLG